ncbi:MAG: histidine triad nucleotide-binding protein [Candidatus Humimicrobiaceae bacterium]|jgi:histidine triad (HIT) family protein|nr:histidine triad nucleotide-binding protein [Candidatus Humimicrobiaceae bacterium]
MEDCLFCKIINKEINSNIVFENDNVLIFKDISPQAPVHLLAVPKKHVSSILEIEKLDSDIIKELMEAIARVALEMGLDKEGFRIVTNTGRGAGQSVDHLHFHIMGKRKFNWPPG